jgi:hypothetical protein
MTHGFGLLFLLFMQCILRSVRLLWVAYVVLVGVVGLVTTVEGIRVWHNRARSQNPCLPHPCPPPFECFNQAAGGRTCFNPTTGVTLDDHGVAALSSFNIKAWFDASDLNGNSVPDAEEGYVPAGGLVNEWVSKVGGISATAVGSSPSLDASTVGGKPSVHFTGQYLDSTISIDLSAHFAIFAVIQSSVPGLVYDSLGFVSGAGGWYLGAPWSSTAKAYFGGGTGGWSTPSAWSSVAIKLGGFYSDGTQFHFRTNGIVDGAPLVPTIAASTSRFTIGGRNSGLYTMNGYISEMIIVDGILPLPDVQAVEQYLMSKYSIS